MRSLMEILPSSLTRQKIWPPEMMCCFTYMALQKNFTTLCLSFFNRQEVAVHLKLNLLQSAETLLTKQTVTTTRLVILGFQRCPCLITKWNNKFQTQQIGRASCRERV